MPAVKNLWSMLFRLSFYLLYHQLAFTYDLVSSVVSEGEWRRWQRAALPRLKGERVLEIGSGPGHLLGDMAQRGFRCSGIELSPYMLRRSKRNLRRRRVMCPLVRGRAPDLPFRDATFDSVVLTFPAGYIREHRTLSEISRILSSRGRLLIVDNGRLLGTGLDSRFLNWAFSVTGGPDDFPSAEALIDRGYRLEIEVDASAKSSIHIYILEKTF